MTKPSEPDSARDNLRRLVLGLGERSFRKSWYPELQARIDELERFRSLLDSTVEAILLVRVGTMQIVDANRTAFHLLGVENDELKSRSLEAIVPITVLERIAKGTPTDGATPLLEHWPTVANNRELETSVRFSGEGQDVHAILVVRDVTERLALERQALTSQRLESVGRLAAGIAHDFNNLIGAIVGTVDLVRSDFPPESDAAKDLEDVILVAKRAALLTRRLMSFSRQGTGTPSLVNVAQLARELEQLLTRIVGERARLISEIDTEDAWILADPIALEQVIVNLVSNARDAVEMGGTITLRVRAAQAGEAADLCPFCVLEVEDDGVGMDEATQAKAFEPFFTTKPANRGTGLGLSVVANVVGQCGGRIELSSQTKKGTQFRLFFPRRDKPASLIQPAAQSTSKIAGGGRLVLVVEDERILRNTIERTLRRQGFEVTVAEDVDDALFRIRRCRFVPVLLISDVVLPDGTGLDVAKQLNEKWSQVPTLFISGYAGEQAALMGAPQLDSLLPKPFTPETLMSRIDQILDGR